MANATQFRSVDGRYVRLTSRTHAFPYPWDEIAKVSNRLLDGRMPDELQIHDIFVARTGNADGILAHVLDAELDQVLKANGGGTFNVARSRRSDLQGIAFWRGPHHEALIWLPSEDEGGYRDPFRAFEGLEFEDHPDGLEIRPASGHDLVIKPGYLGLRVPGVGSLSLTPAEDSLQQIPSWSGRSVDVGEVWQVVYDDTEAPEQSTYFTMATPTLVATLFPESTTPRGKFATELEFMAGLGELSLK